MSAFVISSPSSRRELAELPAEPAFERAHDAIDRRGDLLVRERAVRALEDEPEGEALAALRDAGTLIAIEELGAREMGAAGLADRGEELAGRELGGDDHGEVAAHERVARHLAVAGPLRRDVAKRPEIDLEQRARRLDLEGRRHLRVDLSEGADHPTSDPELGRRPGMEVGRRRAGCRFG